jgi:hypothetical protein
VLVLECNVAQRQTVVIVGRAKRRREHGRIHLADPENSISRRMQHKSPDEAVATTNDLEPMPRRVADEGSNRTGAVGGRVNRHGTVPIDGPAVPERNSNRSDALHEPVLCHGGFAFVLDTRAHIFVPQRRRHVCYEISIAAGDALVLHDLRCLQPARLDVIGRLPFVSGIEDAIEDAFAVLVLDKHARPDEHALAEGAVDEREDEDLTRRAAAAEQDATDSPQLLEDVELGHGSGSGGSGHNESACLFAIVLAFVVDILKRRRN